MEFIIKNGTIIISEEDYDFISKYKWQVNLYTGYVSRSFGTRKTLKKVYLHRELMGFPEGMVVDHINRNKLDNRRINLRVITQVQNNFGKKHKNSSSMYFGVCKKILKKSIKWTAQGICTVRKTNIRIGYYEREIDAAIAVDIHLIKNHGLLAKTNILPPMPKDCVISIANNFRLKIV